MTKLHLCRTFNLRPNKKIPDFGKHSWANVKSQRLPGHVESLDKVTGLKVKLYDDQKESRKQRMKNKKKKKGKEKNAGDVRTFLQ